MVSYVEKLFPFLGDGDFIRNSDEVINIDNLFCPLSFIKEDAGQAQGSNVSVNTKQRRNFKACRVFPCNLTVIDEPEHVIKKILTGFYGPAPRFMVTEYDYTSVASRIEVSDNLAYIYMNKGYRQQEIETDIMINSASNGMEVEKEFLSNIKIQPEESSISLKSWMEGFSDEVIMESADAFNDLLNTVAAGKELRVQNTDNQDAIYKWLDSYFALPEGESAKSGGREVVPLLIGPTGVFKSATIKELCKKYDYRLVDFRVAFTSRLDYSGLFQMGEVDGKKYSYACPMEEIVTCSDGFREYCRRAYDKVSQILQDGYIIKNKASDGSVLDGEKEVLSDDQRASLEDILSKYKEYMKTPVLFLDEITRCKDAGVEGLLTEMLNQKRFNNMTLSGCKFVAATNLNLRSRTNSRHNELMDELDEMYDVNTDIDVAYANRFLPLRVQPEDVQDRWFSWAESEKVTPLKTVQHIHPIIIDYLKGPGINMVYNDTPVLDALEKGLTDNETKAQSYPNYRTWEMVSDYLYSVDDEYTLDLKEDSNACKLYRTTILNGLLSEWGASQFIAFLIQNGYKEFQQVRGEVNDEYSDFLSSSLDAGVPALMVGPSSIGKTSRVKAYIKKEKQKTGLEPVLINIDLSSKDVVDLMGMPSKISLVDYVSGGDFKSKGLDYLGKELGDIVKSVCKEQRYGISDTLTVRAPDKSVKDSLEKAKREGREVVFFFDECNRVKNSSVLSSIFEVTSDARYGGVDFSDMKDKVKVIAACNMAHSEMGDEGDYGSAGAIDPALAARFSVFWKKHYDAKDVKSWIDFMEQEKAEGKIDGTIIEYFKNLDVDKAIEIIASVEKRQLAYAEPSTRNLHQLSMDIKSMRGNASSKDAKLFYGKLLFDDMTRTELGDIYDSMTSSHNTDVDVANKIVKLCKELLSSKDIWESLVANKKVSVAGRELSAGDLLDNLDMCATEMGNMVLKPLSSEDKKKLQTYNKLALSLLQACNDMDDATSQAREAMFEQYVGEGFAKEFTPYFNENFGSEEDEEITIEMLKDSKLVRPFFRKYRASRAGMLEEAYEDSILDLMREFIQVHGDAISDDACAEFISGAKTSLASPDGMSRILKKTDSSVDPLFVKAEKVGDAWILDMLQSTQITKEDIDIVRQKLQNTSKSSTGRKRKSVVL